MKVNQANPLHPPDRPASAKAKTDALSSKQSSSFILQPSSFFSRWRKTILGTLLVLVGLAMAVFTIMARNLNEPWLASTGAVASLVFALLITILVVPPLTRSAYAEVTRRGLPLDVT